MISVNGVTITEAAVARELQHHPAGSREEAARLYDERFVRMCDLYLAASEMSFR